MTWDGRERRSSLTISGPWALRVAFVGTSWALIWLLVGLNVALGACVWAGR
jgi:hypothetical protein